MKAICFFFVRCKFQAPVILYKCAIEDYIDSHTCTHTHSKEHLYNVPVIIPLSIRFPTRHLLQPESIIVPADHFWFWILTKKTQNLKVSINTHFMPV